MLGEHVGRVAVDHLPFLDELGRLPTLVSTRIARRRMLDDEPVDRDLAEGVDAREVEANDSIAATEGRGRREESEQQGHVEDGVNRRRSSAGPERSSTVSATNPVPSTTAPARCRSPALPVKNGTS
jgi:hypothetical protein